MSTLKDKLENYIPGQTISDAFCQYRTLQQHVFELKYVRKLKQAEAAAGLLGEVVKQIFCLLEMTGRPVHVKHAEAVFSIDYNAQRIWGVFPESTVKLDEQLVFERSIMEVPEWLPGYESTIPAESELGMVQS